MPNPFFRFKQFTIYQDQCAMKVGTDGVLLGAWSNARNKASILDVGTGTGLIALMLAQRNSAAVIDAIEMDNDAARQATQNVDGTPFSMQISVHHQCFQHFALMTKKRYEFIVCNPPFFVDALKSPNAQRTMARHTQSLSLQELFSHSRKLLTENGRIALILPYTNMKRTIEIAQTHAFFLSRRTTVKPLPHSTPKRVLLEFSNQNTLMQEDELVIELSRHCYSDAYRTLTRDFYLKY